MKNVGVLEGLEGDVTKTLQSIQKGITLLDGRRASLSTPQADPDDPNGDDWESDDEDGALPDRN
jgi:hypothetical protein